MQDKIIDFQTAKLAKEKGFDYETIWCYLQNGDMQYSSGDDEDHDKYNHNLWDNYSAPTQSLLQTWLREKHKIDIVVAPVGDNSPDLNTIGYYGEICRDMSQINIETETKETYEEALEQILIEALKLIK
jgi:hypothetical protein